jgi:glycosyltransferase involved in cell wall biosynthesis
MLFELFIANDIDGARDVIINGVTGYLVTPRQPQEMAERILYLLANDQLCNKMGIHAKQHSERFSSERMLKEIEFLYRGLLNESTKKMISYTKYTEENSKIE